ncbi:hypothetical protein GUITHDRAFT_114342 [Guillardia theta CCMP2712]|uniref:Uncharacterized protein n=1 Tax=Guillardia theta (strain CCMP2712) TaxID=905079 RepID=L1ITP9_GUITC|nr:hypothetical protein GUITHDRAFT_114342 [Guillardia theta CCMP2712]EKX39613.1 hypothetical protein GUITHDRAFT_114342 [Guillardia theta CCMP2712]|eukprot:XP_005826593.1 hypothetical protein GUITHDRAFT_114342 [Guillardia theta CCMP2712]
MGSSQEPGMEGWRKGGGGGGKSSGSKTGGTGAGGTSGSSIGGDIGTIIYIVIFVTIFVVGSVYMYYKRIYLPSRRASQQVTDDGIPVAYPDVNGEDQSVPANVFELNPQQAHAYIGLDPPNKT